MSEHDSPHADEHHDEHHDHGGLGKYLMVALALVVLTALSYWTFTPLWPTWLVGDSVAIKRVWMMAVSCSKAMLVILFFMHLLWEANWKWVLTIPASCMSVFLALALVPDVGMRLDNGFGGYSRERLIYAAELPDEQEHGDHHADDHDSQHAEHDAEHDTDHDDEHLHETH